MVAIKNMKAKNKGNYLHLYKSDITKESKEFAKLHQLKLIEFLSVYSHNPNRSNIDKYLETRKDWADDNEVKWGNFKYFSCQPINETASKLRINDFWTIQIEEEFKNETYRCFTTERYLRHLSKTSCIKAWVFHNHPINGINPKEKYYKLSDVGQYNSLIRKGKIIVFDPFVAKQCLKLREKFGHTVEYIRDEHFLPKYNDSNKKGHRKGAPKSNEPKDRLVCITDGTTVTRTKQSKAEDLIKQFPTMKYCSKHKYHTYLDSLNLGVVKQPIADPKGPRKQRRSVKQKRKFYRHMESQLVERWVPDETGKYEIYEGAKTIYHKMSPTVDTPKTQLISSKSRKKRLLSKYKERFESIERRDSHFTSSENWSRQFMELIQLIKEKKPEWKRKAVLMIADIYPGWNDKDIRRLIEYIQLTKHGLNYEPNKKKLPVERFKKEVKETKGIEISKFPYNRPIAVEYKSLQKDGTEKISIEPNVVMRNKQIIKDVPNQKLSITICPVKDVIKWVSQDKYSDKEGAKIPWINLVTITTLKRTKVVKVPFHLPVKTKRTKRWKHPISPKPINRRNSA
jgi:hypothetical protein